MKFAVLSHAVSDNIGNEIQGIAATEMAACAQQARLDSC